MTPPKRRSRSFEPAQTRKPTTRPLSWPRFVPQEIHARLPVPLGVARRGQVAGRIRCSPPGWSGLSVRARAAHSAATSALPGLPSGRGPLLFYVVGARSPVPCPRGRGPLVPGSLAARTSAAQRTSRTASDAFGPTTPPPPSYRVCVRYPRHEGRGIRRRAHTRRLCPAAPSAPSRWSCSSPGTNASGAAGRPPDTPLGCSPTAVDGQGSTGYEVRSPGGQE